MLTAKDQHTVPVDRILQRRNGYRGQWVPEVQAQDLVREPFVQFP